jgi:hypothetical protein
MGIECFSSPVSFGAIKMNVDGEGEGTTPHSTVTNMATLTREQFFQILPTANHP